MVMKHYENLRTMVCFVHGSFEKIRTTTSNFRARYWVMKSLFFVCLFLFFGGGGLFLSFSALSQLHQH